MAFKRQPPENDALRFIGRTKLMMKLDDLPDDASACSEDALENSFDDGSDEEEEEGEAEMEEEDEESDPQSTPGRQDEQDPSNNREQTGQNDADEGDGSDDDDQNEYDDEYGEEDSPDPVAVKQSLNAKVIKAKLEEEKKPRKVRKPVLNVAQTDYSVVKKCAKRIFDGRLRHWEEDHEGAVWRGEGGKRLSPEWDLSWHDLTITADFLSKMQPYQRVSQYPGIYVLTRKNYLARNLMKM
jgi:hypothetical protein